MTATPSKSLSQQFLDAYLADPEKNPYGQFYTAPYAGSLVGELPRAYEQYGALADPLAIAQQYRGAGRTAIRQAGKEALTGLREARTANYEAYKQPYTQAKELFRQQRAAGFESPEAEEQARQGLAAVREATFLPYLAKRGYLKTQERLTERGYNLARQRASLQDMKERLARSGADEEYIKETLKGRRKMLRRAEERAGLQYGAVKDVGRGGEVELGNRLSLDESLVNMMNDATWAPVESAWRKENAPAGGYGYASRPEASEVGTTGPGLGGVVAGVAQAVPTAMSRGPIESLDVSRGGSAERFNMADLRAAREQGYGSREIRQYLKQNPELIAEGKRQRIMKALRQG